MQKLVRVNKAVSVTALSSRCIGIALRALSCFETLKRKLKHIPSLWKLERQYQRDWEKIFEHSPLKTGNSDSPADKSCEICINPSFGDLCVATEVVHNKYVKEVTARVRGELYMFLSRKWTTFTYITVYNLRTLPSILLVETLLSFVTPSIALCISLTWFYY